MDGTAVGEAAGLELTGTVVARQDLEPIRIYRGDVLFSPNSECGAMLGGAEGYRGWLEGRKGKAWAATTGVGLSSGLERVAGNLLGRDVSGSILF